MFCNIRMAVLFAECPFFDAGMDGVHAGHPFLFVGMDDVHAGHPFLEERKDALTHLTKLRQKKRFSTGSWSEVLKPPPETLRGLH